MGIYDLPAARLNAMYRLSVARNPQRTLVVTHGAAVTLDSSWANAVTYCSAAELVARSAAFEAGSLDAAIIHIAEMPAGDNAPVGSLAAVQTLIATLHRLLRPGGSIAGQFPNRYRFDNWRSRLAATFGQRRGTGSPHGFTASRCRKLFGNAGFSEIEVYVVLPSPEEPEAMINLEPKSSQLFFADTLEGSREDLSPAAYWLRRGLIRAGVYGKLVGSFLCKGQKPC
jgi:hypothetical protein